MKKISRLLVMVVVAGSASLWAAGGVLPGGGTEGDPYLIEDLADFDVFAGNSDYWDDCIRLEYDIDLSSKTYTTAVIAPDTDSSNYDVFDGTAFAGIFDGNGHKIINLTIDTFGTSNDYLGLFGKIGSLAEVKALGVENCNIAGGYFSGYLGVLVGENNEGNITNCYATGSVAGGNDSRYVGGLVGMNNRGNINNCYATSNATGGNSPGGFAGNNDRGDIKNCYATGSVTGFSDLGGFVGDNDRGHIINCFWDMQTSGKMQSDGGFGRSTTQMKDSITYIGWGDGLWTIDEGNDYPGLVWENAGGTIIDNIPERSYSGTGLEADPFIITVAEDMYCMTIRQQDWNGYFELKNDIDMTGITYLPPYNFTGTFNGNGYEISNLTINEPGSPLLGLFGSLGSGSVIYNLGLINVVVTGSNYIGGLVGKNNNDNISNCYVSGSVSGDSYYVGGLVGRNEYGSIIDCYTMGTVTSESGSSSFGGLVGENYKGVISNCWTTVIVTGGRWSMLFGGLVGHNDGGNISTCYVMGNVNTGGSSYAVGGLVGMNDEGIISNSYAMGSVSGSGSYFAGLVGKSEYGSISNCYATGRVTGGSYGFGVGGLVGWNDGNITSSFWDVETSGIGSPGDNNYGAIGKTTVEMQALSTFTDASWDFIGETANGIEDIWFIPQGDYPHLWWAFVPVLHGEPEVTLGTSNSISWYPVVGGVEYYVECAEDPNFTSVFSDSGWIAETSCEFIDLELGRRYWYRVKAKNAAGVETGWSNVESSLQSTLGDAVDVLLDPASLKNEKMKNALLNKIDEAMAMIEEGNCTGALGKLEHDILAKTNGCAETGEPDKNDWIIACEQQSRVYGLVMETIEYVRSLIE